MKYLVPVARVDADDCARMAAAFVAGRALKHAPVFGFPAIVSDEEARTSRA